MRRFLAFLLVAVMLSLSVGGTVASAEENSSVIYYAKIQSVSAVYDRNTEMVSFCIDFKGTVLDTHTFTVVVNCAQRINGEWRESGMFGIHTFRYSDCVTSDSTLEGEVKVGKDCFFSDDYKDWTISVAGKKLNTSIVNVDYYSMDSATVPVSLKALPQGDFYKIKGGFTPTATPVGGFVELKLELADIVAELSGGLTELAFDIGFDKDVLRVTNLNYNFPNNEGWTLADSKLGADKLSLSFSGDSGLTKNGALTVTVRLETIGAGTCGFTVSGISGGDAYGNSFTNSAGYAVGGTLTVTAEEKPPVDEGLLGDTNGDGEVDSLDAAGILKYDAGIIREIERADVNGDGEVDSLDAAKILKYDAGIIPSL